MAPTTLRMYVMASGGRQFCTKNDVFCSATLGPDALQVGTYGDPGRDPRGWTVTVAYAAVVPSTELGVKAAVSTNTCCREGMCACGKLPSDSSLLDVLSAAGGCGACCRDQGVHNTCSCSS